MSDELFQKIEKKTGVNKNELFELVHSLNGANLKDEKTVRRLIRQVARLANRSVSRDLEDRLVKAIINNEVPSDFATISKMLGKK